MASSNQLNLETQRAKRHRRIRALGTTGQVAGAASEQVGLAAHPTKDGLPVCVLPMPLVPVPATLITRPDSGGHEHIFMPGARRSRRLLSLRDTARAMSQEKIERVRATYDA